MPLWGPLAALGEVDVTWRREKGRFLFFTKNNANETRSNSQKSQEPQFWHCSEAGTEYAARSM